jgi:hypothetical protein
MIFDIFSIEEINLMCAYDTSERKILIRELASGINGANDKDMTSIFISAIEKLEAITDGDFAEIGFYAAEEFDEYLGED